MNERMKQKLLLAVVAVVALGAGGFYWFSVRDTDNRAQQARKTGPVKRKERAAATESKPMRKTRRKAGDRVKTAGVQRKERKVTERKTSKRRGKGRTKRKEVKKKKEAPAA